MSEHTPAELLEHEVQEHGEAHAVFEEHDDEVEVRWATTEFDYDHGVIRVEATSHSPLRFSMDSLVSWELPTEPFH